MITSQPEIEIAGRQIGPNNPPYIIAELSGNHNGQIERAFRLMEAAAATGCDAIKIQTYTPDTLTIAHDRGDFVIEEGGPWKGRTLYDLYQEAHTPYEWHPALFAKARELGVTLFSTAFDDTAVDLLAGLGAPAYKVASFEAIDLELIARIASQRKPVILSTGMANLSEIQEAVTTARDAGNHQLALLHCTSAYPAPINEANVRTVPHLGAAFGVVSGLSDHAPGLAACVAATVLGGSIIEKHFTLSRAEGGPDAEFSLEPHEFKQLVVECKNAWESLGRVHYDVLGSERASARFRRSLYAVRPIHSGEVLTRENIRCIRPGFGLAPKHLSSLLGRRTKRNIAYGERLSWDAFE